MGKLKENDDFGNRMKEFEAVETSRRFDVSLPIYARIDGRSFSRFTRGMDRPFDRRMSDAMVQTTSYLVDQTHARLGYTQSDEISLVWQAEADNADIFFSGKVLKMASVLASMAAAKTIKLADLIDNSISIKEHDLNFWKVYREEKRRLLEVLKDGDPTLWSRAAELVD